MMKPEEIARMAAKEITGIRSRSIDMRGPWIATSSGTMHSVHTPSVQDPKVSDIAAGLARECRYNSQIRIDRPFLSCAEHNVMLLDLAVKDGVTKSAQDAFAILMFGATKAYLRDMAKPVMSALPDYRHLRDVHRATIEEAFLCAPRPEIREWIREMNERIRLDERQCLLLDPAMSEGLLDSQRGDLGSVKPTFVEFRFMPPHEAMTAYLHKAVAIARNCDPSVEDPEFVTLMKEVRAQAEAALMIIPERSNPHGITPEMRKDLEQDWRKSVASGDTWLGLDDWIAHRPEWTIAARSTYTVDIVSRNGAERFYIVAPDMQDDPTVEALEQTFREMTGIEGGDLFFCRTSRFDLYQMGREGYSIAYAEEACILRQEGDRIEFIVARDNDTPAP